MTSGGPRPSTREFILVLCEGKNDVNLIRDKIGLNWNICKLSDKTSIYRRIIDLKSQSPCIIDEGGKDKLKRNLRDIVSKLRSIGRISIKVLALIDTDDGEESIGRMIDNIVKDIDSMLNNPNSFQRNLKPKIVLEDLPSDFGKYCKKITVKYHSGGNLSIYVFAIPKKLEYWLEGDRYLTAGWYRKLKEIFYSQISITR